FTQCRDPAAVLRPRRSPRRWRADPVRRSRRRHRALSQVAAGSGLMARVLARGDAPEERQQALSGPVATSANSGGPPARAETAKAIAVRPGRRLVPWRRGAEPRFRLSLGWLSFAAVVALPMMIAALYYMLIAADQYVAEFRFAVRSAEPARSELGSLLGSDV